MKEDHDPASKAIDDVGALIVRAGRRPSPAADMQESVRAAVEQAWRESASRRRFRHRSLWLSAAASLAAVAAGLLWMESRHAPSASADVATFVAAKGLVSVSGTPSHELVVAGGELPAGATVSTGSSGYALITDASVAVRIGPDTTLLLEQGGHVSLTRGRLYGETVVPQSRGAPLVIDTPLGQVAHFGTRFQVVVASQGMIVSVRTGHVSVTEDGGRSQRLGRGEGVQVLRDGAVRRIAVSPFGASWAWVNVLEPDFPIDGRSLADFLAWYTRETGLKLVLLGGTTAVAVSHTTLSGSIAGLTPNQALAAIMATTGFEYDMTVPGELRIRMRGAKSRGT
jgi:ferric-dicitrate binding protein FerR (iron transport regulator)